MTPQTEEIVRRALHAYRGDDYERALVAYSRCTPAQMQELYGASGQTRQEILDGYKRHVDAVKAAQNELLA